MTSRSITVLGATGSIGASTLDLIRRHRDEWRVVALTAHSSAAELAALAREFAPDQRSPKFRANGVQPRVETVGELHPAGGYVEPTFRRRGDW